MIFHRFLLVFAAVALVGCAAPRMAKDLPVPPAVTAQVAKQFEQQVAFQTAVYAQAQRMAALGYCSPVHPLEPFQLMTTGFVKDAITDEQRTAYSKLGVDHKVRVVWVDPKVSPNVKVGDVVVSINGRDLEARDETSIVVAVRRGRYDLKPGEKLKVVLEGGKKLEISGNPGCEAGIHSTFFDLNPHQLGFDLTPGVKLPTNLLAQAENEDDIRWLAAFGAYITSSPEAESRKFKAQAAGSVGIASHIALAIIPGGSYVAGKATAKSLLYFGLDGVYEPAAEFATREVFALGGDPARGIEMFARAESKKLQVGIIEFTPEQYVKLRKLGADLKAGTAKPPEYRVPVAKR